MSSRRLLAHRCNFPRRQRTVTSSPSQLPSSTASQFPSSTMESPSSSAPSSPSSHGLQDHNQQQQQQQQGGIPVSSTRAGKYSLSRLFAPKAILLLLPDGSVRMYTEPMTVADLQREFPGHDVGSVTTMRTHLAPEKVLHNGSTYYLTRRPCCRHCSRPQDPAAYANAGGGERDRLTSFSGCLPTSISDTAKHGGPNSATSSPSFMDHRRAILTLGGGDIVRVGRVDRRRSGEFLRDDAALGADEAIEAEACAAVQSRTGGERRFRRSTSVPRGVLLQVDESRLQASPAELPAVRPDADQLLALRFGEPRHWATVPASNELDGSVPMDGRVQGQAVDSSRITRGSAASGRFPLCIGSPFLSRSSSSRRYEEDQISPRQDVRYAAAAVAATSSLTSAAPASTAAAMSAAAAAAVSRQLARGTSELARSQSGPMAPSLIVFSPASRLQQAGGSMGGGKTLPPMLAANLLPSPSDSSCSSFSPNGIPSPGDSTSISFSPHSVDSPKGDWTATSPQPLSLTPTFVREPRASRFKKCKAD